MKAYVICCNDSVEYVVLNDEDAANIKKEELKNEYFEKNKHHLFDGYESYERICYWHLQDVSYT